MGKVMGSDMGHGEFTNSKPHDAGWRRAADEIPSRRGVCVTNAAFVGGYFLEVGGGSEACTRGEE